MFISLDYKTLQLVSKCITANLVIFVCLVRILFLLKRETTLVELAHNILCCSITLSVTEHTN